MRSSTRARARGLPALALCALALMACREGSDGSSGFIPIPTGILVATGCNGPDQTFMPVAVYMDASIGPMSQIAAPLDPDPAVTLDTIILTGGDGSVRELDFSGGTPPVETILVTPAHIDTVLLAAGIACPAVLSGVTVADANNLLVIEHTSNSILLVDRRLQNNVTFFAGDPNKTPGFADSVAGAVRFSFEEATTIVASGNGAVLYVADSGNHALRRVTMGPLPFVETIAGTGAALSDDGVLEDTRFDTPVGLSISCGGELLVTEKGGHRLRSVGVGAPAFFGGFAGDSVTLAGDGTEATVEGIGTDALLAAPCGLASTSTGEVFWVDSTTGVLRRYSVLTRATDCPGFVDCSTAVAGPIFTQGGGFSVAISEAGILYVLDADAGMLYRITQ